MGLIRRSLALLLPALLAATPAAASDPFVTVKPPAEGGTPGAFWILEMESRPTGSSVAGLSVAQINAALPRGEPGWCAADALTPNSFSSSSTAMNLSIFADLMEAGDVFRTDTRITGLPALALVGNARTCAGATVPFLLLVDHRAQVPRILYVRSFADWTPFIALRADGNRLIVSSCLECDHAEILSYNRRTRRFVWRSAGL